MNEFIVNALCAAVITVWILVTAVLVFWALGSPSA